MAISAPRDANRVPVLMGVSSADGVTPVLPYVDPVTHRLYVNSTGGAGSTTFIGLTDVPASYTGQTLKGVRVNAGETALEFYNAGVGSGITRTVSSISTPQTAGSTASVDYVYLVSGTTTLTLPTAVGNVNQYTVKNISGATTVATTSAQTINGSSTVTILVGSVLTFISDNANWHVV